MNLVKSSIKIFNVFFDDNEYKLTPLELYFYALLASREIHFYGVVETTINRLSTKQNVFKDKNANRIINSIKNVIISLAKKKVIAIEIPEKLIATTELEINIPFLDGGYEHMYYDLFSKANNEYELYVLSMLNRFNKNGFKKSRDKWYLMLGYTSENSGIEIVKGMETDGKIYCVEGEYYKDEQNRLKQNPPTWFIGSNPNSNNDSSCIVETVIAEAVPEQKKSLNNDNGIDYGNWKGRGNLTDKDFMIYVQQKDINDFMKVAEAKIKRISNSGKNEKVMFNINKGIEEAERIVARNIQQEEILNTDKRNQELIANKNDREHIFRSPKHEIKLYDLSSLRKMSVKEFYENCSSYELESTLYENETVSMNLWDRHGIFGGCSIETKEKIYEEFLNQLEHTNSIDTGSLLEMKQSILSKNNKNKAYNEEWEGDIITSYGDRSSFNTTMNERIKKHNDETGKGKRKDRVSIDSLFE